MIKKQYMRGGLIFFLMTMSLSILSMDRGVIVRLPDCPKYSAHQEKIGFCNVLTKKQVVSKEQIERETYALCVGASNAGSQFYDFFSALPHNEQTTLTNAVGIEQLGSPLLTMKILACLPDMSSVMRQHMHVDQISDYLYTVMIERQLSKRKGKKTKKNQKNKIVPFSNGCLKFDTTENFCVMPQLLVKNNQCNFNGHCQPAHSLYATVSLNQKNHILYLSVDRLEDGEAVHYCLASDSPLTAETDNFIREKSCSLFRFDSSGQEHCVTKIVHDNPIVKTMMSPDCHYLISYSDASQEEPFYTLLITTLELNEQVLSCKDMILSYYNSSRVTGIGFNPQSTVMIIASQKDDESCLKTWDLATGAMLQELYSATAPFGTMVFNAQGTRMLTATTDDEDGIYILWNTEDPKNMIKIAECTLDKDMVIQSPRYNSAGTILVIPTTKGGPIFINSINGALISLGNKRKAHCYDLANIVFMPSDLLCLINKISLTKDNGDTTELWNTREGSYIGSLLSQKTDMRGVGLSANAQYAVVTLRDFRMIRMQLLPDRQAQCLSWIKRHASLEQMYVLSHIYEACKNKRPISAQIANMAKLLPTSPCNIRAIVKEYLVKKNKNAHHAR